MNKQVTYLFREGKGIEIREEPVEESRMEAGQIGYGYYRNDGMGHSEKVDPYFNLESATMLRVSTYVKGDVGLTLHTHNETAHHGGPALPKEGGTSSFDAGYWHMYFLGSIGKGEIQVRIYKA